MVNQINRVVCVLSLPFSLCFCPMDLNEVTASFSFFMHQNVVLNKCALTLLFLSVWLDELDLCVCE